METAADWLRRMLDETGVPQSELARAVGVDPTVMSKMVNGKRRITADERAAMAGHFGGVQRAGFAEEQAAFERAAGKAPVYRARAAERGEWIVDRGAGAVRLDRPPEYAAGFLDIFGFHAPDGAAWPRYKVKERVWVCPHEIAAPGDDVLIFAKSRHRTALRGVVGELTSKSQSAIVFRDFSTGAAREMTAAEVSLYCLVSREK